MGIDFKAKIYVDDVKNEIDDHMRSMKSYFDNKFMDPILFIIIIMTIQQNRI